MKIQRLSTDGLETPNPIAFALPPQIEDRAAEGLCWVTLFAAVTSVVLTAVEHVFQPEFAEAWRHPVLRIASILIFVLSVGLMVVQRSGWLTKRRLLDLGMLFQVAIAFACGLFEAAAYQNPETVVLGHSGIAVWMVLCSRLMPNAPLKSAITAALCVAMWPLGYWVDLHIYGFAPISTARMLVWVLPLAIVGIWMYVPNGRTLSMYVQ